MSEKQTLIIEDRKSLKTDSVTDIESFAEDYMIINTKYGKLNVEGNNLKIIELLESEGKLSVVGEISGVFFREEKERRSLFKRKNQ